MSLREGKVSESGHRLQNSSMKPMLCSSHQPPPPPLISDNNNKDSCSCSPFDCICSDFINQVQSYQQFTNHSSSLNGYDTSHYSHTPGGGGGGEQSSNGYYNASQNNDMLVQSCQDFPSFHGDLFQPEEIFQLDQPLRPSDQEQTNCERSPTIILDLGNGTNVKNSVKFEQEGVWTNQNQLGIADDGSSNDCTRYSNLSPNSNVFQQFSTDFNKFQDYQEYYNNNNNNNNHNHNESFKSVENYDGRENLQFFYGNNNNNNNVPCEKYKNVVPNFINSEIDGRNLCFTSPADTNLTNSDCRGDYRYLSTTEEMRQEFPVTSENDCKLDVKNYSSDYGIFQDVMPIQDNFNDYYSYTVNNKICDNFEPVSGEEKTVTQSYYFFDYGIDSRPEMNPTNNSSYYQSHQHQIFHNNQSSHFQHGGSN